MMTIGTVSYGVAALAFAAFTLLMLTGWRGRLHGALLTAAGTATLVWAVASAYEAGRGDHISMLVPYLEILRDVLWFAFLLRLILPSYSWRDLAADRKTATVVGAAAIACAMLIATSIYPRRGELSPVVGVDLQLMGFLVLSLVGLVLVEQVYRNTLAERRWAIKFLCVGVGGLFAFDFFLYSDALLFKRIDMQWWSARGFIDAVVVPLIAVAVARNPEWSLDIYVSRSIVFHTTTLLAAGAYLLAMAAGGYYIRLYGGDVGEVLEAIFLFGAVTALVLMMVSGRARAHLRVFLSKHFFNYKYDYREEWLRLIRTLSTAEQNTQFRELTVRAVAQIVDSPSGWLWFRDDAGNYVNAANWNVAADIVNTVRSDSPMARFLEAREWVIEVGRCTQEAAEYDGLELPPWLCLLPRAWLIVPLMQHERLMGFMVLTSPRIHRDIDWEDCDLLKTVGRQVASYLGQRQASEALFDAKQFEALNRFSTFVIHDLKNLVAQLSLVVSNAAKHKNNPQFMEDAISTVDHCVRNMKHLLGQMRTGSSGGRDTMGEKAVNLTQVVSDLVAAMQGDLPAPLLAGGDEETYIRADPQRLSTVIRHIVQNALEATPPDGSVTVRVYDSNEFAVIEVADTGCGMDADFIRDRLFRPFDSTKGKSGMGIGVYETREWVRERGGEIEVTSRPGKGTVFKIRLPKADVPVSPATPVAERAQSTA